MQTCVLLSIKPEFVEKIFAGTKKYEFRRVIFKSKMVKKILVYASSPIQKVVGEFEISKILSSDPSSIWDMTKEYSGIEESYFSEYFNGKETAYAIKIKKCNRYKKPLDIKRDYNISQPPQSFAYVNG